MQVIADEHTSTGNIQSGYAGRDDLKRSPSADDFAARCEQYDTSI